MSQELKILGKSYEILDAIEYITLADSFVKNKIGTGHGEAKLYVGNENDRLFNFFGDFNGQCFFCKKDFASFLADAESEFKNPQQRYVTPNMIEKFNFCLQKLSEFKDEMYYVKGGFTHPIRMTAAHLW